MSVLDAEPREGNKCHVCSTPLPKSSLICARCGAAHGEANRCPHCNTIAGTEPHPSLKHGCRVCGGPRVPASGEGVERSGKEVPDLLEAGKSARRAMGFRLLGGLVGGFGALSLVVTLLVLLVANAGFLASVFSFATISIPLLLAAWAWRKGGQHAKTRDRALDAAWSLVVADVLASRGEELTAKELGEVIQTSENEAEQLLATLRLDDHIRARVTDEGELVYSTASPARLRVAGDQLEEEFAQLEEQAAERSRARSS